MNEQELLEILKDRFESNRKRHPEVDWADIERKILADPRIIRSLDLMEESGGEPDLIVIEDKYLYVDCSAETPKGRRSICYDNAAWEARKANKPETTAEAMAKNMDITILDEAKYQALQAIGAFDLKTSSWLLTPDDVRSKGGALFGDRRYGRVFTYHNGADSYYAARGFRGYIEL